MCQWQHIMHLDKISRSFFKIFIQFKEINHFLLPYLNILYNNFHYHFLILFKYSLN
jgi:hypothetical protein